MGFLKKLFKKVAKAVVNPLGLDPLGIERRIKMRRDAARQSQIAEEAAMKQEQANAATGNATRLGLFSTTDTATVQTNAEAQAQADAQTTNPILDVIKRKKLTSRLGII